MASAPSPSPRLDPVPQARANALRAEKKKGCKQKKCSKWRGGGCRCGRD